MIKDELLSRRDFLVKSMTALSVIYVIPDILPRAIAAKPFDQKVSSSTKWAMNVEVVWYGQAGDRLAVDQKTNN